MDHDVWRVSVPTQVGCCEAATTPNFKHERAAVALSDDTTP